MKVCFFTLKVQYQEERKISWLLSRTHDASLVKWGEINKSYLPSNAGIYILIFLIISIIFWHFWHWYFLNVLNSLSKWISLVICELSFIPIMISLIPFTTLSHPNPLITLILSHNTQVSQPTDDTHQQLEEGDMEHLHQNFLCEIFKSKRFQ